VLFALLTGAFFASILTSPPQQRIGGVDITHYFEWIHRFIRAEFLAGRIPLWNPYNYAGIPFAANPQCTVFYPPSWLVLLIPVVHAHKWMIALHVLLAGSFMHLWLRLLGVNRIPATIACLPWMFGSYVMANAAVGHLTMIFTMTWLPLAAYCYERSFRSNRARWLFWTGLVLGTQILAGEPQNCYYTVLVVAGYGLVRWVFDESVDRPSWHPARYGKWLAGLAMIGAIAALASGIQFFITAEYMIHSDRAGNSLDFAVNRSFPPSSFLGFLVPWSSDLYGLTFGTEKESWYFVDLNWEFTGYVGVFTLVLAGLSVCVRRNRPLLAVQVLAAFAVLLMLGGYTPIYALLYRVLPGLQLFRIPARAIVILVWAISVMAAFGLNWLLDESVERHRANRWRRIAMGVLTLLATLAIIALIGIGVGKAVPKGSQWWRTAYEPLSFAEMTFLGPIVLPLAGLLLLTVLPRLSRRLIAVCVALLIAADLWWAVPDFHLQDPSPRQEYQLRFLANLRTANASVEPFRMDAPPHQMSPSLALEARVESINGYWPLALGRFYRFVHAMRGLDCPTRDRFQFNELIYDPKQPFPLRIMNVRYALSTQPADRPPHWLANERSLPRAWLVERFEVIPDEQAALERLRQPGFDPARTVILEKDPGFALSPADSPLGSCTARKPDGDGLDIETNSARPSLLVTSEIFYPGWKAHIDGEPAPLLRADDVITALRLPAGRHRITLRYEPASFLFGCITTGICGLVAVILWATSRRSRRVAY